MILKNTQITWKLKEGIVLKYGPASDVPEKNDNHSELISNCSEKESEFKNEFQPTDIYPVNNNLNETPVDSGDTAEIPEMTENRASESETSSENSVENTANATPQSYPDSVISHLVNVSSNSPVVDGVPVSTNIPVSTGARWQSLPYRLRPKRADVFIDMQSSAEYLSSLTDYLKKCGLDVKEYNDEYRYLPSDIILADSSRIIDAGTVLVLQKGKRYIWDALLKEFGARLNVN